MGNLKIFILKQGGNFFLCNKWPYEVKAIASRICRLTGPFSYVNWIHTSYIFNLFQQFLYGLVVRERIAKPRVMGSIPG